VRGRVRAIPLWIKLLGIIGLLAAACVGLTFVPTGEVAYAPVAPIDLDGKITLAGRPVEPLQGHVYLVGVTERRVNLLQRWLLDIGDPNIDFGPAPAGTKSGSPRVADVNAMVRAKDVAAAVAFQLDGRAVDFEGSGATVALVSRDGPADPFLRRGDVISRINGTDVDNGVEASRLIGNLPPGSAVRLGVLRDGQRVLLAMKTIAPVEGDRVNRSRIGVSLDTINLRIKLPSPVGIDSGEVVGPSGGLAFALYLYDALDSESDLLRGRHVVATGALSPEGRVAAVGRMRQKATAAQHANRDLLVVPKGNLAEAQKAIKAACSEGARCVRVVGVDSVQEAISILGGG